MILGAAFKANSDDARQSLSYKVRHALERERSEVTMHDPHIPGLDAELASVLGGADLIFIATNHDEYKRISLERLRSLVGTDCLVCDIWNIFGTDHIIFSLDQALKMNTEQPLGTATSG